MTRSLVGLMGALLSAALLSGCSIIEHVVNDANQVHRVSLTTEQTTAKAADGAYENLYPKRPEYPVTCKEDCYPPHPDVVCETPAEHCQYQGQRPDFDSDTGFDIHWLGHATFKITSPDGQVFLFDPVSEEFDWPINWAHELTGGFTRETPQWLSEHAQNKVDAVLYSHLHYDHFNKADIKALGADPTYFVHLDTADYLPTAGLKIMEVDWFASHQMGATRVQAMPAHHFNSRYWVPFIYNDDEQALWGGWLLESEGKTLFFAGDTGYSEHFKEINRQVGDIDICLMPIASYHHDTHGRWYRYVHTTPEDTLIAAQELGCKVVIPWGYGNKSWKMGDRSTHAPLLRLLKMQQDLEIEIPLLILNEGDRVAL